MIYSVYNDSSSKSPAGVEGQNHETSITELELFELQKAMPETIMDQLCMDQLWINYVSMKNAYFGNSYDTTYSLVHEG